MSAFLFIEGGVANPRGALFDGDQIIRFFYPSAIQYGDKVLGKVLAQDTRLGGVFVDIGADKNAFLALPVKKKISTGATVRCIVQRPQIGRKGAIVALAAEADFTDGEGSEAEGDTDHPVRRLIECVQQAVGTIPPRIGCTAPDLLSILNKFQSRKSLKGELEVSLFAGKPLIEMRDRVHAELDLSLDREVPLPQGGRLIFDEAEALTAIDVDLASTSGQSAQGAVVKLARQAVPEILRQLQLRQIGGQIVIDFPGAALKNGEALLSALKTEVKKYEGVRLGRADRSGLVPLILPRREPSLLDILTEFHGTGPVPGRRISVAYLVERAIFLAERNLINSPAARLCLETSSDIFETLTNEFGGLNDLIARYGERLEIRQNVQAEREWFDVSEVR